MNKKRSMRSPSPSQGIPTSGADRMGKKGFPIRSKTVKIGFVLALIGGVLYLIAGVTTAVNPYIWNYITLYLSGYIPQYTNIALEVLKFVVSWGGIGILIGAVIAAFISKSFGGKIILISMLGGLVSYGLTLYFAYENGLFDQPISSIIDFIFSLGMGLGAVAISLISYFVIRRRSFPM